MKKIIIVFIMLEFIVFINPGDYIHCNAENKKDFYGNNSNTNEIINTQKETLDIQGFIKQSEQYTKKALPGIDLNDLLSTAISGNIDNVKLIRLFVSLFGKESLNSSIVIGSVIVIVVIHGILKSIGDSLENKSTSQVAYFVQYILIVSLIMTSFAEIIEIVKQSIQNLVAFINLLIPILITLMITTGSITSAGTIQPILLFMVTIIGNFIVNVVIPIVLVSTALGIISQISDKVQIDKLAKFFKSSTIWVLGVMLTLFVGITSLEGSLSSSIDRCNSQNNKSCSFKFHTCCWENFR